MGVGLGARAAPCTRALPVDITDRKSHLNPYWMLVRGMFDFWVLFWSVASIPPTCQNTFWRVGGMGAADQNTTRGAGNHSHIHMLHSMDIPEGQVGVGEIHRIM
jgi:hypothetical protein